MFKKQTVFILGAGASWHYGYPLGEDLVKLVVNEAQSLANYHREFEEHGQFLTRYADSKPGTVSQKNNTVRSECEVLANRLLELNPPVIDYFLGHSPSLQNIGRLLIALIILKAENQFRKNRVNANRTENRDQFKRADDWCRFINYQLAADCRTAEDLFKNAVRFITFNYDTSLEKAISDGLSAIEMFPADTVAKFLDGDRVVHVYGQVGRDQSAKASWVPRPARHSTMDQIEAFIKMINLAYDASAGIKTIAPDSKSENAEGLTLARRSLANAQRVYILGYGFDPNNSALLGFRPSASDLSTNLERLYYTNKGDSNQVNKRASQIFFGNEHAISSHSPSVVERFERSTRDAYQALCLDFDVA